MREVIVIRGRLFVSFDTQLIKSDHKRSISCNALGLVSRLKVWPHLDCVSSTPAANEPRLHIGKPRVICHRPRSASRSRSNTSTRGNRRARHAPSRRASGQMLSFRRARPLHVLRPRHGWELGVLDLDPMGRPPALYGRSRYFETSPSRLILQAAWNRSGPISPCSNGAMKMPSVRRATPVKVARGTKAPSKPSLARSSRSALI